MNKIALIILSLSLPLLGFSNEKPFGRIVDVKGTSFLSFDGKTKEIKNGDIIYFDSEIFVEATGQVSFTDNAEHRFHLSSSSSASLKTDEIELRSGNLWVQSINPSEVYEITTANAKVDYTAGEGVISYDSMKGKSQLLVINGMMKLSNLRKSELNLHVGEGHFSFIDHEFEAGSPRTPTAVGNKTFNQLISNYAGIETLDKKSLEIFKNNDLLLAGTQSTPAVVPAVKEASRGIASVKEEFKTPAQKKDSLKKKELNKLTTTSQKVEINIYGLKGLENSPTTAMYDLVHAKNVNKRTRMPASAAEEIEPIENTVDVFSQENEAPIIQHYQESDTLLERLKGL